nr:unnamed protein product [Callosobruchus analis]
MPGCVAVHCSNSSEKVFLICISQGTLIEGNNGQLKLEGIIGLLQTIPICVKPISLLICERKLGWMVLAH